MFNKQDPLKIIFEKHFYENSGLNEDAFCAVVVRDYLNYLKYSGAIIPGKKECLILNEVREEVYELLYKYLKRASSIKEFFACERDFSAERQETKKKYFELF